MPSILDLDEINGSAWQTLKVHIDESIDKLRAKNDSSVLDLVETAVIRGEISALKKLKSAVEPKVIKTKRDK